MKIKNFVASIFTVTTLALIGVSVQTQTVDAATVSTSNTSGVVYVSNANGAQVYSTPDNEGNVSATGSALGNQTSWQFNQTATVDGVTYYQVSTNQWISSNDSSTNSVETPLDTVMYVKGNGGNVNIYDAPNGNYVGSVNDGGAYKVAGSKTDVSGNLWYNLGNCWIKAEFLTNDNVKETLTMSATAYDPAVLGSSMGYSGVAANLSKFPKGTHLRITANDGTVYDRVVNDTGLFAYSNPNQLDIAMPNSQALQFGRQNITVQVIG
ncbi:SLAP domain-containing protein [Companilactobacillus nuruki]|uniref:Uncharacterized protein n=1 Tax=Companilactobacillus nuruki TaxID=1993540 RepID=A0A2N7AV53_9LACO|nr:SLAP domain-containing protein [Companilactobacillus nuruki]PMD72044.1 hypothetical protein CBP76_04710 [Companilactobacillus nuruki]